MAQMSPDVTIARWRKYGKDRLYVTLADGTKIGYWDLVTDEPHPEKPELARLLETAYDVWCADRGVGSTGPRTDTMAG